MAGVWCVKNLMLSPGAAADDSALISAARQGEAEAFAQLFDRYHSMIHAFAFRLCGHAADADDIAQEAFIKAGRGMRAFRGGDFRSWLYRIAANCARDFHRDAARRARLEQQSAEELLAAGDERTGDAAAVTDALASLPPEHRETVVLVYFEGLNHAEAARVLGCAETTVSWRLFRAKRQLKTLLSRQA
jgi:RNA polymerase sigma-70 factor (ECF subfamily)